MELEKFEADDRILFNDRKLPLKIEAVDENRLHVNGPRGGEYIIFPAEDDTDTLLVANKGSREYATLVENLRNVGRWERGGDSWTHTKTGETVSLEKNDMGFWTIETSLETDLELPKYGFSDRESAVEEAEKIVRKNPEGR